MFRMFDVIINCFFYSGLEFTLTFLTHHTFQYTSMEQGWMFFGIGLIMAILQSSWVRKLPHDKIKPVATLGLLLIIPSFVLIGLATTSNLLILGLLFFAICKRFNYELPFFFFVFRKTNLLDLFLVLCSHRNGRFLHDNISFKIWSGRSKRYNFRNISIVGCFSKSHRTNFSIDRSSFYFFLNFNLFFFFTYYDVILFFFL